MVKMPDETRESPAETRAETIELDGGDDANKTAPGRANVNRGLTPIEEGLLKTIVPGAPDIQSVSGPNPWKIWKNLPGGRHACYFCRPDLYEPMPECHTLCARCGQLVFTAPVNDPCNSAIYVCPRCDREIDGDL